MYISIKNFKKCNKKNDTNFKQYHLGAVLNLVVYRTTLHKFSAIKARPVQCYRPFSYSFNVASSIVNVASVIFRSLSFFLCVSYFFSYIFFLTILTWKNFSWTEFSTKIHWTTRLADSDVFHMFRPSVNFF